MPTERKPAKRPIGRPRGKIQNAKTDIYLPETMLDAIRAHAAARFESTGAWWRRAASAQLALEDTRAARAAEKQ